MSSEDKELVGAATDLLILACLAQKPSYGYEIVKNANERSGSVFKWQEGTLYPVLHKLERDELVRAQWQIADTGRRRRYYYITAKGRAALGEKSAKWKALHRMLLDLMGPEMQADETP